MFDATASAVLLVTLSPILAVIALVVAVSSPGPVLFKQERVGRSKEPFVMYKFRTMVDGADDAVHREFVTAVLRHGASVSDGGLQKLVDDDRVTWVGSFLRRLSLDELPQLFNVLRGTCRWSAPVPRCMGGASSSCRSTSDGSTSSPE